jgi:hypothetical protein
MAVVAPIKSIRYATHSEKVRLVLDLTEEVEHRASTAGNTIVVTLSAGQTPEAGPQPTEQHDHDTALQSFQPTVKNYAAFFQKNPKLLTKVSPPQNPRLKAFSITHFLTKRVYYDIHKTTSIVTPYDAYIDIDTGVADNKRCGNVSFNNKDGDGWANIEDALRNAGNASCFAIRTEKTGPIRHRFHFQYQARKGRWELSGITYADGKPNGRFMALLGVSSPWFPPMDEPRAISYNKGWIQLFTGQ